jgi:hypothetical protein
MMAFISACATSGNLPPAKDIKSIVGKWEGYGYNTKMSTKFHMWLLIRADGKWLMNTDAAYLTYGRTFDGSVWVDEGEYIFKCDTPGLSGTGKVRSSMGNLWLMYRSNDGATSFDLTLVY